MGNKIRIIVSALSLSAAGFVGILLNEGYSETAMVPVRGDVPTIGFGSTTYADGTSVQMGQKITPVRAVVTAQAHITKEENRFRASMPNVPLHQVEYDLYMDWVYQYGMGAWNKSSMRSNLLAGNYAAACESLLRYKYVAGRDCSIRANGCYGVWTRQLARHQQCTEAQ